MGLFDELAERKSLPEKKTDSKKIKGSNEQTIKRGSERVLNHSLEASIDRAIIPNITPDSDPGLDTDIDSESEVVIESMSNAGQKGVVIDRMSLIPFKHNFPGNEAERKKLDDLRDLIASKTGKKAPRKEDLYRQFFYEGIERMNKKYERMI